MWNVGSIISCYFIISLLISCVSSTPYMQLDKLPPSNIIGLKIALIIDEKVGENIYKKTICAKCKTMKGHIKSNGKISFKSKYGGAFKTLFTKKFHEAFTQVDIYNNAIEIKNNSKYDYT